MTVATKTKTRRPGRPREPIRDRLWAKAGDRSDPNACWEWTANRTPEGYGAIQIWGRKELAHRVAYELEIGPIPTGLYIDHLCRNRACVNPRHLEPVTPAENIRRGSSAKLTQIAADQIRARIKAGEEQRKLALEFGVSQATISMVKHGKKWATP